MQTLYTANGRTAPVWVNPQGVVHLLVRHYGRAVYVPAPGLTPTPTGGLRIRAMGKRPPLSWRAPQLTGQRCPLPATHPARTCATAQVRAAQRAHIAAAAPTYARG